MVFFKNLTPLILPHGSCDHSVVTFALDPCLDFPPTGAGLLPLPQYLLGMAEPPSGRDQSFRENCLIPLAMDNS